MLGTAKLATAPVQASVNQSSQGSSAPAMINRTGSGIRLRRPPAGRLSVLFTSVT